MNGSCYGRIDGITLAHNYTKRQQLSQQHSGSQRQLLGSEWTPQQQLQTSFNGYNAQMLPQNRNNSHLHVNGGIQRTHSAGSHVSNPPLYHMNGSYDNIAANRPLTKQVDQLLYEIPQKRFSKNALCQPPEFLKVFSDVRCAVGEKAVFDCMLLGSPRPRVCWLFNDDKMCFNDVLLEDSSDICRCTIKHVQPHHYGIYTILAENEVGRAITTATLLPISCDQF